MGCYEPFFPPGPCADPQPPYFLTAYEIAVKRGFQGTEEEWLDSLTAFRMAQEAGYTGTAEEWLATLNDPVPALQIGAVETLPSGSNATASITGDKKNPILNLGIPKGIGMENALSLTGGTMKGPINMGGNPINNLPEPAEDGQAATKGYADRMLPKAGGTMEGPIDMGSNAINNLPEPAEDGQAATKGYADRMLPKAGGTMEGPIDMGSQKVTSLAAPTAGMDAANKDYVDGKHRAWTVTLTASGWSASAPYTQTVTAQGMLASDRPVYGVVYSSTTATAIAQKEAFAMVDDLDTAENAVTFTCFEEKPEADLTIQMEVNR